MGAGKIHQYLTRPLRKGFQLIKSPPQLEPEWPVDHSLETITQITQDAEAIQQRIDSGDFDGAQKDGRRELVERVHNDVGYYPSWVPDDFKA